LNFAYSTIIWEHIGQAIALIAVVISLIVAVRNLRRRQREGADSEVVEAKLLVPSPLARWIARGGMVMLAVAALAVTAEWFGLPSALPAATFAPDPYALDIGYGAVAIAILLLSLVVLIVVQIARSGRASERGRTVQAPARMGFAAMLVLVVSIVVSACGAAGSPDDVQNLLSEAQQAGSVAPTIQGASLDDARLQRSAREPELCIADYTTALQEFPDLATAYAGRGDCYLNGGKNGPAAVHDYSQAISLTPDGSDLFLRRAVAYRVSGNVAAAVADYQQAATIPSGTAAQHLTAVDGLVALEYFDIARTVYRQALARDPQSSLLHLAGADIAVATGDDQLADQEFATAEQLVTNKNQTASVLSHLCHVDVLRHNYAKATTDCPNSAQLTGNGSGAEDDLSAAELALGNPSAALTAIDASIGSFVGNIGPYAQASGVDGFGLAAL
jgi:tetratricopeptide (TPR) repeat protein